MQLPYKQVVPLPHYTFSHEGISMFEAIFEGIEEVDGTQTPKMQFSFDVHFLVPHKLESTEPFKTHCPFLHN
jgi:hypothetical protein